MERLELQKTLRPLFDKLFDEALREFGQEVEVERKKKMLRLTFGMLFEKKYKKVIVNALEKDPSLPEEADARILESLNELLEDNLEKMTD